MVRVVKRRQQIVTAFVYDKRGRLLSVGNNSYKKTHPLQAKYSRKTSNPHRIYLHAELDALLKARSRGTPHKIVVMRVNKEGVFCNAAPCECCKRAIKDFDVKVVEHT